jgi:hypothetical protein
MGTRIDLCSKTPKIDGSQIVVNVASCLEYLYIYGQYTDKIVVLCCSTSFSDSMRVDWLLELLDIEVNIQKLSRPPCTLPLSKQMRMISRSCPDDGK